MKMIRLILIVMILLAGVGCADNNEGARPTDLDPTYYQQYELGDVKKKAKQLKVGMPKRQVMMLLGSPAKQTYSYWQYLPDRSGLIIPAFSFIVEFQHGRVTKWRDAPIILGADFK